MSNPHAIADHVARTLARPDPLLAWLTGHEPGAIVGLNASVENGLVANFLREHLALPKRIIKVHPHKTEVGQFVIVIHPAWLSILLQSFARLLPPLTPMPAGDMQRAVRATHKYWATRMRRHYWGGLRDPGEFYE